MSSSEGFGGGPYDHLKGQGAAGFTPENMNTESDNHLSKKKRNKNRSSGANGTLQLAGGSKTVDKSSGFLPKNGRKSSGPQQHNNNTNNQPLRRPSQSEYEVLREKEDLDNRSATEFNGNFNGFHSPKGSTAAAWNGKQDNTKAIPDPSSIVERLMHLRDCIKQVTTIMNSLEKTDEPVAVKQMSNLNQMLHTLRKEEQENMELLQQVLACREGNERASLQNTVVARRELSPLQVSTTTTRRRNNPVLPETVDDENEEPQNDLLLRMLDSQKKFATIREQQASLLRLQKQAEEKLAVARAFHDQFVQSNLVATDAGMARSVSSQLSSSSSGGGRSAGSCGSGREGGGSDPLLTAQDQDRGCDYDEGVMVLSPSVDDLDDDFLAELHPPVVPPRKDDSSRGNPAFDLQEIQNRISVLMELQVDRQAQCDQLEDGVESVVSRMSRSDVISREQAQRATHKQRQLLEGKLRQLQQKKHQMDTLLAELTTLQNGSVQSGSDDQLDIPSVSPASFPSPVNSASHEAKVESDIGETQRKLKQLEEMKNTLRTLQRLTENIEQVDNSLNKEEILPPPPPMRGRSQSHSDDGRSVAVLKPDNLRRDCQTTASAQFPARRHYEAEGRANEDADAAQNVIAPAVPNVAALAASAATSSSSNDSNGNGSSRSESAAGDSRSMDHKVQKLADAETKLQRLKLLLSAMQQGCEDGSDQPYAASLLSTLHAGQAEHSTNGSFSPVANNNVEDPGDESEDSGVSAGQAKRDQVIETGQRQIQLKHDLDLLLRERRRLATMQEQLSNLQLEFTPSAVVAPTIVQSSFVSSLNNSRDRSSGEGGSTLRARAGSASLSQSFTPNEMGRQDNLHRDNAAPRSEAKTLNSQANNAPQSNKPRAARARGPPQESLLTNNHRAAAPLLQDVILPASRNSHNNNNSQTNNGYSDLDDQLTYNLALRDELRTQKAVLQELLRQERSKQMGFSHNQDTQSHSESSGKTDKSEPVPVQCQSSVGPIPPPDHLDPSAGGHWGLLGNFPDESPPCFVMPGFDDQQQSGSSSPWQKNFPSASPAHEDVIPFQQMAHVNLPRRMAPPRIPPSPLAQQPQPPIQQQQRHSQQQEQQQLQWDQMSRHFQKQAENTHAICQSVLQEQQAMILLAAGGGSASSSTGSSSGAPPPPTELVSSYVQQLQQQQQLLFSLSHCFQLLCLQQMQVAQVHAAWAVQSHPQAPNVPRRSDLPPSPYPFPVLNDPLLGYGLGSHWTTATKAPPAPQAPPFFQAAGPRMVPLPFGYPPVSNAAHQMAYNVISGDDNASVSSGNSLAGRSTAPETLNNQMPPRSRTNNFLDNFRSNSRQNLLSGGKCNDPSLKVKPDVATLATSSGTPTEGAADASGLPLRTGFVFSGVTPEPQYLQQQQQQPPTSRLHFTTEGGGPLGGVRPRTKRPNMSQDKSNTVIRHGPTNLVTTTFSGCPTAPPQLPANRNAPTVFAPPPTTCFFGKATTDSTASSREQAVPSASSKPFLAPASVSQGDTLQERIYSEVDSLLSQWEEQPSVLRELLQQIRAFEGPGQDPLVPATDAVSGLPPAQQRCNLLDLGIPVDEKLDDATVCSSKLSKQQASFGSKRAKTQSGGGGSQGEGRPGHLPASSSSPRGAPPPPLCLGGQHKNLDLVCQPMQIPQRHGSTNGMESIPESYTMTVIKSEKPDIVSHLRGGTAEGNSEESFSLPTPVSLSSTTSSSSSNMNNNNNHHKAPIPYHPINQSNEDYRAAPDGGAAPPPSQPSNAPATLASGTTGPPNPAGNGAKYPEDCGSFHYDAEGETEAETEDDDTKDLAEADQSAGQSGQLQRDGAVGMAQQELSIRSCSSSMSVAVGGGAEGGEELGTLSTDIVSTSSTNPCCSCPLAPGNDTCSQHSLSNSSAQASAPDMEVDELALDDVPIKLETLSAEELRRQISDEQASNCLLGEILSSDAHGTQLTPENDNGFPHSGAF